MFDSNSQVQSRGKPPDAQQRKEYKEYSEAIFEIVSLIRESWTNPDLESKDEEDFEDVEIVGENDGIPVLRKPEVVVDNGQNLIPGLGIDQIRGTWRS
jgi:hypothetical protein